jgi:hypothetical protein
VEKLLHVLVNAVVAVPYNPIEEDDDLIHAREESNRKERSRHILSRTILFGANHLGSINSNYCISKPSRNIRESIKSVGESRLPAIRQLPRKFLLP